MTFLARSRFAHELAALDCLLLACRHAGMPVGLKVIGHTGALMMPRRVKRQQHCRPVLDDPHARVAPAMEPTRVTCGTFAPTCPRHLVCREIGRLAPTNTPGAQRLSILAQGGYTGSALAGHASCRTRHRPSRSRPVTSSLGLRGLSTAGRSRTYARTCVKDARATSRPRSMPPARRFTRDSPRPPVALAGCHPARRARPVTPRSSGPRGGAAARPGGR